METDISQVPFPRDIEEKIAQIALKTNSTPDEVKVKLMTSFFALLDNKDAQDVPAFIQKVRTVLKEVAGAN